jgi:dipeptidyl aminopeptidase/acylaminoacyl peptidase
MLLKRHLAALALSCSALLALPPASPAHAQRGMNALHAPGNVALSPDGSTVAWTLRSRDGSTLHLLDVAAPTADKTIDIPNATGCAYSSPIWSSDGATLAFLGACAAESKDPTVPRQSQIYLWSKSSGDVKQLTHVTGDINQPTWSPDGKSIAFLFVENATRTAGALDAMKPWAGVIGEDGVEVQRVYGVDVASGTGGFLTPLTLHVYEFDWAPSSNEIAYIGADAPGENNWWIAQLWAAPVRIGVNSVPEQPRSVFNPNTTKSALHGLQIAVPRYSPDGKKIALIAGLMSDQGSTGASTLTARAHPPTSPPASTAPPASRPGSTTRRSASSKTAAATPASSTGTPTLRKRSSPATSAR